MLATTGWEPLARGIFKRGWLVQREEKAEDGEEGGPALAYVGITLVEVLYQLSWG